MIADTTYTFGPFAVSAAGGELRRDDVRIKLAPKVFDLLLFFVENDGRLLSKQELMDAVWPDVHVEQGSLNRAVARLRIALADSASSPRYIETVPRRGFRFIAAVRETVAQNVTTSVFQLQIDEQRHALEEGDNILGRADDCQVTLKSGSISRHHTAITISGDHATVRDLESKNGTFVQGRRVRDAVEIRDGNSLRAGSINMRFIRVAADQSTVTDFRATDSSGSRSG